MDNVEPATDEQIAQWEQTARGPDWRWPRLIADTLLALIARNRQEQWIATTLGGKADKMERRAEQAEAEAVRLQSVCRLAADEVERIRRGSGDLAALVADLRNYGRAPAEVPS